LENLSCQLPNHSEIQNIYVTNNITPGDSHSFNTRSFSRLLTIISTNYEKDISQYITNVSNLPEIKKNYLPEVVNRLASYNPSEALKTFCSSLSPKNSNEALLNLGLQNFLIQELTPVCENAFKDNIEDFLSPIIFPTNLTSLTDSFFKNFFKDLLSQNILDQNI
jgi:hypothetical protein